MASVPARPILVAAAILALLVGGVLVERAIVTDEEELEQAWDDFLADFEAEDGAAMGARFLPSMAYEGPSRMVGKGDRASALTALAEFGELAHSVRVTSMETDVAVQGQVGVVQARGRLVFKYGSAIAAWTWAAHVAWGYEDGWKIQQIDVLELKRGLF